MQTTLGLSLSPFPPPHLNLLPSGIRNESPGGCLPRLAVVGLPTVPSAFPSRQPDGSNESAAGGLVKGIPPL